MKYRFGSVVPLCVVAAMLSLTGTVTAIAQNQASNVTPPPKVLEVIVEYLRPGQSGTPHQKTEAAFAQAMRDAKWQQHYLGTDALTGRSRAVFFIGYDSFADWEKDTQATMKNASLSGALDQATVADGALLQDIQTSVYRWRDDLSLRPGADLPHTRYFDVTIFRVKPGHEKDWDTVVKMYRDGYEKIPDSHWDMFEKMYGTDSAGTFVLITPMKSLTEVDEGMANDKKLADAVGPEQMQKMQSLAFATADVVESHLLAINPKMSYVGDDIEKGDPSFWGQR